MPFERRALRVTPPAAEEAGYPVEIQTGGLAALGARLRAWGLRPGPVAVVSEATLLERYGGTLWDALQGSEFAPVACPTPGGEAHKTLASAEALYPLLAAAGVDRGGVVLGFGGGVVGDLAGFVAATWLRGVGLVQVPTTLLAMIDSALGGKVGVDLPSGKNLVGAFKQPLGVAIDPALLGSLPLVELRAGLAELVKHALIADPELFAELEAAPARFLDPHDLEWTPRVARAAAVKVRIVSEDPLERGRRALLNLGHTFGHAFELCSGFALRHGEAVAVGLVAAAALAEELGRAQAGWAERVAACLTGLGLPVQLSGWTPRQIRQAMTLDKKRVGGRLRFVLTSAPGAVELIDDPGEAVERALSRVLEARQAP